MKNKLEAVKRGFTLAEKLPQTSADEWIEKQFSKGGQGLKLIQLVQSDIQRNVRGTNITLRNENLKNLKQIVNALMVRTGDNLTRGDCRWQSPARHGWSRPRTPFNTTGQPPRNGATFTHPTIRFWSNNGCSPSRTQPKPPSYPGGRAGKRTGRGMACGVAGGRRARAQAAVVGTLLKDKKILEALDEIERLAKLDPAQAGTLSNTLLSGWAAASNPNGGAKPRMPTMGMPILLQLAAKRHPADPCPSKAQSP